MYFDEPAGAFDRPLTAELKGVLFVTAVVTLFFFILPGPIVGGADAAALALFAR
jgi:NADH-quinone oxidoreductase subunit N